MDLQETKKIVARWIKSCETSEQLALGEQLVDKFIVKPFEADTAPYDLEVAKSELNEVIATQRMTVVKTPEAVDVPTLTRNQERYNGTSY